MSRDQNADERAKSGGVEGVSVSQNGGGTHDPLCTASITSDNKSCHELYPRGES